MINPHKRKIDIINENDRKENDEVDVHIAMVMELVMVVVVIFYDDDFGDGNDSDIYKDGGGIAMQFIGLPLNHLIFQ